MTTFIYYVLLFSCFCFKLLSINFASKPQYTSNQRKAQINIPTLTFFINFQNKFKATLIPKVGHIIGFPLSKLVMSCKIIKKNVNKAQNNILKTLSKLVMSYNIIKNFFNKAQNNIL